MHHKLTACIRRWDWAHGVRGLRAGHVTALVVSAYAADSVGTPQSLLYLAFHSLKMLPGVHRIILLYRLLVTIVLRALLEG